MEYSVRTLRADDVDVLREMLDVFGRAFDDVDRYCAKPPHNHSLQARRP